jgi:HEAT repeat protein
MPSEADLENASSQSPMLALVNQRRRALIAFKILGPVAAPAIPELKDLLTQKDTSIHAASALAAIGVEGVSVLLAQSTSPDKRVQANVVQALSQLGDAPKDCLPVFVQGLKHNLPAIRATSAIALGSLTTNAPPEATAALVASVEDKDPEVRLRVVLALGRLGPAARTAAPALVGLLKDPDTNTVNLAAHVLWKVDPEAARKAGAVDKFTAHLGKDAPKDR